MSQQRVSVINSVIEINDEINGNGAKFWWAGSNLTHWLNFGSRLTGEAAKTKLEALPGAINISERRMFMNELGNPLTQINACESSIMVIPIINDNMWNDLKRKT